MPALRTAPRPCAWALNPRPRDQTRWMGSPGDSDELRNERATSKRLPRTVLLRTMNNAFQHVEVLKRNRTRRHRCGECFVEGVRPIQRMVDKRWRIRSLWSDGERSLSSWAESIVEASGADCHYRLPAALMAMLSDREDPSE